MFISRTSESLRTVVRSILEEAGIEVDGGRPWDIHVHDDGFYRRVIRDGSLGLGEAYMDGWWDAERLDAFFHRLLRTDLPSVGRTWRSVLARASHALLNHQNRRKSRRVAEQHYDLGNDLFEAMLDARMAYSCGYWKRAESLDEAQEHKLDLICRKLQLEPGMRVLDVGCGWGSFAQFAAERYGVSVLGINNSNEQTALARERCAGLPAEIRTQDYRDVEGRFDAVVSIGMFEHVGPKNYRVFMEQANRCLKDDGLFLLHTIGSDTPARMPERWTERYIFPGGMLPAVRQVASAAEDYFVVEDWHNFGADYDPTLMAWYSNFEQAWQQLRHRYGDRFYRMWTYYLLSFAGAFRARYNQLWQIVFSKRGVPGGYVSIR